jgi:hypothetical protein
MLLQELGFDNHEIAKMIPDRRPIIDAMNMPISSSTESRG